MEGRWAEGWAKWITEIMEGTCDEHCVLYVIDESKSSTPETIYSPNKQKKWAKVLKRYFSKDADSPQIHKKMLNVTYYQGHGNENYSEIAHHTC